MQMIPVEALVGIGLTFLIMFGLRYILEGELILCLCIGITISVAGGLFPVWAVGIVLVLIAIYLFQEFFGGEGSNA